MAVSHEMMGRLVTTARKAREWKQRRDEAILEALASGGTQAEVAKLVKLTQPAISALLRRAKRDED